MPIVVAGSLQGGERVRFGTIVRIAQHPDPRHRRSGLFQELDQLSNELPARVVGQARDVSARMREARDESVLDRVAASRHHDRYGRGRLLGGERCRGRDRHDDIDIDGDKLRCKSPQALLRVRPEALFDDEIASFDPAQLG